MFLGKKHDHRQNIRAQKAAAAETSARIQSPELGCNKNVDFFTYFSLLQNYLERGLA